MTADLNNQKAELEKFLDRITALKSGILYQQQGNKAYYTVDFSEIYSYLHYGDPGVSNFGVSVTPTRAESPEKANEQHYLALTHLFNSFSSSPLYLLQPYMLEMYSYTRRQAHHSLKHGLALSDLLGKCTSDLKPAHRSLLQELEGPEDLTQGQRKILLEEMASDYPTLSIDLLEYDRWREENTRLKNRGQLLNTMIAKRKITHRLDEMLEECGIQISSVEEPPVEDEKKVAELFPGHADEVGRQFARLLDARAILILRNINRLLEPRGARLILITRDTKSPKVAERLETEEWFGWKDVKKYFYGIETVYIDLILQHKNIDEKLKWLEDAERDLTSMLQSLEQLRAETNVSGRLNAPAETSLSKATKRVLERNAIHWNKLTELEFLRISPVIDWLGEDFVNERLLATAYEVKEEVKGVKKDQIALLQNLVAVVDSNEFQEVASVGANDLWFGITGDVWGMVSLGDFKDGLSDTLDDLKQRLQEHSNNPGMFKTRVERSVSFSNMPTINFTTEIYRDFVKDFKPWAYERDQALDQIGQKLTELFSQAASKPDNPESWLFMAFVMGMLDYWPQAIELAKQGLSRVKRGDGREFEYLIAEAKFRAGKGIADTPREAIKGFISAYDHIRQAIKFDYSDARFLERQAVIALYYADARKELTNLSESELEQIDQGGKDVIGEPHAIQLLIQAERRAGKDRKLRVRALNNLAFVYVIADPPQLDQAVACVNEIQKEFDQALERKDDSLPDPERWPFVVDTLWYIRAKIAFSLNDLDTLDSAIDGFQGLLDKAVLLPPERKTVEAHLKEVKRLRQSQPVSK